MSLSPIPAALPLPASSSPLLPQQWEKGPGDEGTTPALEQLTSPYGKSWSNAAGKKLVPSHPPPTELD
ncbi:hypothetical protein [Thermogemmata fonticola]|uniref:Uncharacterized protein n=1 Tax=Thermogemmata fonticola TaxID=2755323 RepID=A0A7V8VCS6_9BACT|nr:hypothetical protein [Thermogemmata fonticola]MBA2225644.1 hypothetical protein [Thermogemmata fonticola]